MSICSCSFRALSRSRLHPTKTLTPFLYQTATIQQWNLATRSAARRNASSNTRYEHDIPFENETESHALDDVEPTRYTTITGSERAAFETLYKKFRPTKPPRKSHEHEIDQVADEYYEDEEENDADAASIDTLFDAVLSGKSQGTSRDLGRLGKRKTHDSLSSLAQQILEPQTDGNSSKEKTAKAGKATKTTKEQTVERARVKALLSAAKTDRELWMVLEKEVFDVLRELNLDGENEKQNGTANSGKNKVGKRQKKAGQLPAAEQIATDAPHAATSPSDKASKRLKAKRDQNSRLLFQNYPTHLVAAANILRTNFPSSPLPLAIIPTLKSLGRSSYALGATTTLYRNLIRTAWQQQHSYDQICGLLQDMDNGGIQPDMGILMLLDMVLHENRNGRRGRFGRAIQAVWNMQTFDESVKQLSAWRDVVAKRLGVWAETRVVRGEVVRRVVEGEKGGDVGPKDEFVLRDEGRKVEAEGLGAGLEDDVPLVEGGVEDESGEVGSEGIIYVQDAEDAFEKDAAR